MIEEELFQKRKREAFLAYLEGGGEDINFDIYSQPLESWLWLQELIPGILISSAGGSVSFQAEGLLHGHPFYFKDRGGYVFLNVGELDGEIPYLGDTTLYGASAESEPWRGRENFVSNLLKLVPLLKKTPFPYEFSGRKVSWPEGERNLESFVIEDGTTQLCAWGFTPAEAFEKLGEPMHFLIEKGWSEEFQKSLFEAQKFDPRPLNKDERRYPSSTPDFSVNLP